MALSNLKLREALRQQSIRDSLTGLFNRRYMEETLEREIRRAEREKKPVGIIMFDIDHFKNFNDLSGHDGGDAMLRELGAYLSKSMRGGDIVCRYGGEEFVAVLPGASLEETRKRAEDLRQGVKEMPVYHLGKPLGRCTISLGVSAFPDHGLNSEIILKGADSALYRAKNEGRDKVVVN
jgi:diguanylate cyclase (GGDEF)-like protein